MNREINIRLNANRAKAVHTGHKFASGDKGIVFRIAVDELDTTGTTAKIVFKRSNGTSVEAGITGTEGVYSYTTLGNEFAVVGPVTADVKFYENENRVSTCTFLFDVTSDTLDGLGNGAAGYSDTLERMKKSMEQAEADILAAKDELEKRAEEILQQMKETAESAEEDVETAEQKMVDLSADLEALYQEYVDAFGSTGPFNPRGPYSETETYTVRDMVTHNDASWVCYRNCTGETPSKESDCWQYLTAGDAKTLDGHGAEYFERLGHKFTIVHSVADMNTVPVYTAGVVYDTALNAPPQFKELGIGYGLFYTIGFSNEFQIQKVVLQNGVIVERIGVQRQGNFSDWKQTATTANLANYFKNTGGEIRGNVTIGDKTETNWYLYLMTKLRTIFQYVNANGAYSLYDSTNNKPIITSTANGTNTFNGTLSTKPTGTYTGNGDTDIRRISISGIGELLAVTSVNGIAIIHASGVTTFEKSGGVSSTQEAYISGNELIMSSLNSALNVSGVTYKYHRL